MRTLLVTLLALAATLLMASAQVADPTERNDKQVRVFPQSRWVLRGRDQSVPPGCAAISGDSPHPIQVDVQAAEHARVALVYSLSRASMLSQVYRYRPTNHHASLSRLSPFPAPTSI
jgi:hypothetical protein